VIIRQVINNNVLFVEDNNGHEMLLMGKGIGYKKKSGEQADVKTAQKIFTRFDKKQILKFKRLMEEIPYEYMHITNEIVEYAQISLGKELDESIYLALVDHLNFAVNRIRQGIRLSNSMLWEIRHYYNHEYRIGLEAIAIIQKYAGLEMPVDEAGFIAVHILNAELNLDMDHSRAMTKIIQGVLNIVKYHFGIVIDEESLDYERFVTHLKFFIQRTMHDKESRIWDKALMDLIRNQYADSYGCAEKVAEYMKKTTPYEVSEEEMMYLTVHLQRLWQASEKIR
jgi:beta-glucoside operon transcriptional antiterminator